MATGIKAAGVDLDSIFEVRTTTKIANVNIKSNGGVDISNRFENIASGSGPSATGIKAGGADLNTKFAEIGTVISLGAGPGGLVSRADGQSPWDTTVGIRFNTNGIVQIGKEINGGGVIWTGSSEWITPTSEASNVYDVRFTNKAGGGSWTQQESSPEDTWIALVDGVRTWLMNSTIEELLSFTCDFEVRDGGGAPPATATVGYTFQIDNSSI